MPAFALTSGGALYPVTAATLLPSLTAFLGPASLLVQRTLVVLVFFLLGCQDAVLNIRNCEAYESSDCLDVAFGVEGFHGAMEEFLEIFG